MQLIIKFLNKIKKIFLNKSALFLAVEKENIEIIKYLLINEKIYINVKNI